MEEEEEGRRRFGSGIGMGVTEIDLTDEVSSGSWSDMRGGGYYDYDYGEGYEEGTSCSRMSLVEAVEARTQRTYRYGIGLVCIGATLNWLGFAQGHGYVDPLRYLGVACVITGSFCVCLAMFRWFGKPFALTYAERLNRFSEDSGSSSCHRHNNGDVHVINVSVPVSTATTTRPVTKPPDYDSILSTTQLPTYYEAIKLSPVSLGTQTDEHENEKEEDTAQETNSNLGGENDFDILNQNQIESTSVRESDSEPVLACTLTSQTQSNAESDKDNNNTKEEEELRPEEKEEHSPPPPYDGLTESQPHNEFNFEEKDGASSESVCTQAQTHVSTNNLSLDVEV